MKNIDMDVVLVRLLIGIVVTVVVGVTVVLISLMIKETLTFLVVMGCILLVYLIGWLIEKLYR